MFRVLTCLTDQHDFRLVFLAAVICAAAAFTSFHIYLQASNNRNAIREMRNRRVFWIGLTGLSTGAGIWATHFVAELAYQPGLQTAYDPTLTIASLLIAIVVTTAGYGLAANGGIVRAAGGGAIVGAGIA